MGSDKPEIMNLVTASSLGANEMSLDKVPRMLGGDVWPTVASLHFGCTREGRKMLFELVDRTKSTTGEFDGLVAHNFQRVSDSNLMNNVERENDIRVSYYYKQNT